MSKIKYQYAYDENNNIIDIKSINKEYRKEHTFHCIGCNGKMKANFCKTKTDYFSHYGDSCSYETYLHKLAKRVFKEKFENNNSVLLKYEQYDLCSKNKTCTFYNLYNCSKKSLKTFDLKEFYNNCQEETPIQNFKADLLLNDITKKYKSPILIEILITHKCSDEKINSGLKIIEIKIDSESDIRTLLNQPIEEDSQKIKLYGFKKESINNIQLTNRILRKITFYKNGKYKVEDNYSCAESFVKTEIDSVADIYIPKSQYSNDISICAVLAKDIDDNLKNCFLCKYYKYYEIKSKIHPNCLNWQNAYDCNIYKEDKDKIDNIKDEIKDLQVLVIK